MGFLERKFPHHLAKVSRIQLRLRGITLWTIWIKRNGLTFNNSRWDDKKVHGIMWQGLLSYARIEIRCSRSRRRRPSTMACATWWGAGDESIHRRLNDRNVWHIRAPNVGLVLHGLGSLPNLGFSSPNDLACVFDDEIKCCFICLLKQWK